MKNTFIKKLGVTALAVAIIAIGTSSFTSADETSVSNKKNRPNFSEEKHEQMLEVMQNADYDAWVALLSEKDYIPKAFEVINQDNFPKFVEAWNLKQEAKVKMDQAKAIYEELGFEKMGRKGKKSGRGGHGNRDGQNKGNLNTDA